jgi:hypothetical protein
LKIVYERHAGVEVGNVGAQVVALQPDCTKIQPLPCTLIADVDDNGQHTYTAYTVNFEHHISKITYLKSYYFKIPMSCYFSFANIKSRIDHVGMVKHLEEEFCGVLFVWRAHFIFMNISRRDIMPTPLRV